MLSASPGAVQPPWSSAWQTARRSCANPAVCGAPDRIEALGATAVSICQSGRPGPDESACASLVRKISARAIGPHAPVERGPCYTDVSDAGCGVRPLHRVWASVSCAFVCLPREPRSDSAMSFADVPDCPVDDMDAVIPLGPAGVQHAVMDNGMTCVCPQGLPVHDAPSARQGGHVPAVASDNISLRLFAEICAWFGTSSLAPRQPSTLQTPQTCRLAATASRKAVEIASLRYTLSRVLVTKSFGKARFS